MTTQVPIDVKISSVEAEQGKQRVVRSLDDIRRSAANTDRQLDKIGPTIKRGSKQAADSLGLLRRAFLAIGGTIVFKQLIGLSDSFTTLKTSIENVTRSQAEYNFVFQELQAVANETGADLTGLADAYVKLNVSLDDNVKNSTDLLKVTELLARGFAASGTNAQTAAGATLQLTQGLATDFKAAGQELNSIIEGAPLLAKTIAVQLGGKGATDLKRFAQEGRLTAKTFLDALVASEAAIKAYEIPATIGRSIQRVINNFVVLIGQSPIMQAAAAAISNALDVLARNMDVVGRVLKEALISGFILLAAVTITKVIPAMKALYSLLIANPIFALVAGVTLLAQAFGGWEASMLKVQKILLSLSAGIIGFVNDAGGVIRGFAAGVEAVFDRIGILFKTFVTGLQNFLDDPTADGNFAAFEYVMSKGVGDAFSTAYGEAMKETEMFNQDLDNAFQDQVDTINQKLNEIANPAGNEIFNLPDFGKGEFVAPTGLSKEQEKAIEDTMKRRKDLLDSIIPSQEAYNQKLNDLTQIRDKLTTNEFNDALAQSELDFLSSQKTFTFGDSFTQQLDIMRLETRNASADMGAEFAKVFGSGGQLQRGISGAISASIVYGRSWKESIANVAASISEKLLTELINVGLQLIFNTQKQLAFNAAAGAGGGGGGGLFGSLLGAVAGSFTGGGSFFGSQGGISRAISGTSVGPINGFGGFGFASGGYTGDMGINDVAGVVHGQEFVMNAQATSKFRPMLEAMNNNQPMPSSSGPVQVSVINNAPGVEFETNQLDENRVEVIARRIVREDAPSVISNDINNTNSKTSKALNQNIQAQRRRQ